MDYELFKNMVMQRIGDFLPPSFHGHEIKTETVLKTNQKKDALFMCPRQNKDKCMFPVVYLDDMYFEFISVNDMDSILRKIAEAITCHVRKMNLGTLENLLDGQMDRIVPCLVNTAMNQELLEAVPHRKHHGMSIIYKAYLRREGCFAEMPDAFVTVNNAMMETMGMSEEELYKLAYDNRKKLFPAQIIKIPDFHVVTCKGCFYGATSIIYPENLWELKNKIGGSFYLIPSSIQEMLAIPFNDAKHQDLLRILKDVNDEGHVVSRGEVLGYHVYFCDGTNLVELAE